MRSCQFRVLCRLLEPHNQWPQYVAYLSSFLIVGIVWLNHHATMNLLALTDLRIQVLNLLLLVTVSVLPWPTALLAEYTRDGTIGDQRTAMLIYGLTSTAMAFAFNALWRYLLRHPELQKRQVSKAMLEVRKPPLQPRTGGLSNRYRPRPTERVAVSCPHARVGGRLPVAHTRRLR